MSIRPKAPSTVLVAKRIVIITERSSLPCIRLLADDQMSCALAKKLPMPMRATSGSSVR
jgi:hypothetical protein